MKTRAKDRVNELGERCKDLTPTKDLIELVKKLSHDYNRLKDSYKIFLEALGQI